MEQAEAPPHPVPRPPPSSSLLLPSEFVQDPAAYLAFVASEPPSHEALKRLAGSVASWFQSPASAQAASQVANIYLQAAAAQLRFEASAVGAAAGGRLEEIEMLHTQRKYEVIEVRLLVTKGKNIWIHSVPMSHFILISCCLVPLVDSRRCRHSVHCK
jgi:hypothetical protein